MPFKNFGKNSFKNKQKNFDAIKHGRVLPKKNKCSRNKNLQLNKRNRKKSLKNFTQNLVKYRVGELGKSGKGLVKKKENLKEENKESDKCFHSEETQGKKKLSENFKNVNFNEKFSEQTKIFLNENVKGKAKNRKRKARNFVDDNADAKNKSENFLISDNDNIKNKIKKNQESEVKSPQKKRRKETSKKEFNETSFVLKKAKNELNKIGVLKKKHKKSLKSIPGVLPEVELTGFSNITDNSVDCTNENDLNSSSESDDGDKNEDATGFISLKHIKIDELTNVHKNVEKLIRTLFVGNLPLNIDRKALEDIFKPFGKIESVRIRSSVPVKPSIPKKVANIKQEYHSEQKSLKGYVVFKSAFDAESALALNGTVVNGHHIRVDTASNPSVHDTEHSVFLGNLPFQIDDESIWSAFSDCGTVKNVRIIRDRETGAGKGFGFVTFEEENAAQAALTLNGLELDGRTIRVKPCEKDSVKNKVETRRKKGFENSKSPQKKPQRRRRKFNLKSKVQEGSNSRKTFKKLNNKRRKEQEKKKIASIFKSF